MMNTTLEVNPQEVRLILHKRIHVTHYNQQLFSFSTQRAQVSILYYHTTFIILLYLIIVISYHHLTYFTHIKQRTVKIHCSFSQRHKQQYFKVEGNKWLPIYEICRSVRKNLSMCGIKTSYPGKSLNNFHLLVMMHQNNHSLHGLISLHKLRLM